MSYWRPIATAPKCGKVICVAHPDAGCFPMVWDSLATNSVFCPGEVGMWRSVEKNFTWGTGIDGESGPDRWCEIHESTAGWDYCHE